MLVRNKIVGLILVAVMGLGLGCTNSDSRKPVPAQVNLTKEQQKTAFWMNKYFEDLYYSETDGISKVEGQRIFSHSDIETMVSQILETGLTHDEIIADLDQYVEDVKKNGSAQTFDRVKMDFRDHIADMIREATEVPSANPAE